MNKTVIKIIIYSVIILLVIGTGVGIYKRFLAEKKKQKILEKVDVIDKNLSEIETYLNTNYKNFNSSYESNNKLLEMELIEFGFEKYTPPPINSINDQIKIEVDTNTYIKEFPSTGQDLTNTIKFLEKTVNNLNRMRMAERKLANTVFTNTIVKVQTTKTNVVYLREEVKEQTKVKWFTYAFGAGFSYNGKSNTGVVLYDLTLHAMGFIYETFYVNLGVGYNYNLYYAPKFSIEMGIKIN